MNFPTPQTLTDAVSIWSFLNRLKTEFPYDSAISLLRYSKELRTGIQTNNCVQILTVALITIAKKYIIKWMYK